MDSNQDFGSILNNFSGSSPNRQKQDSGDGFGSLLTGYEQARAQPTRSVTDESVGGGNVDEFVKSVSPAAQRVAQRLNVPVEAVIGQWGLETGWGKKVIPGTNNLGNIKDPSGRGVAATDNQTGSRDAYRQYGSVDEFADDFANLVGNGRYKAVTGSRDAQSYFQNLQAGGYAEAKNYVQVGTKASAMAADALKRAGVAPAQQTSNAPDLSKAPKWADVEAKPEFKALPADKQAEAKAAYFDYWIAPRAGDRGAELRQQFLAKSEPGFVDKALGVAKDIGGAVLDAVTPAKSVMLGKTIAPEALPTDSKVPVRPEVRAAFQAQWDAATPEQRAAMAQREDWVGMLAKERAGVFERQDATGLKSMQTVDPRIEARVQRLVAAGEDPRFAERAAREAAAAGVPPGREIEFMQKGGGLAQKSEFDFDTKQLFDQNGGTNGLNNPLSRGLAKAGLGVTKAGAGYMQFLGDVLGTDAATGKMKAAGDWARGKENAIGESGNFMERNFEGAINSIAQQLPLLITGTKLESEAVPLAGMAMQSFGQEYSDGRAAGQSVGEATTRASIFAAFEVIGEKFGLKENMQAIKAAARGMPSDQIIGFLWSALKKEVPGELLTTTGQFGTDKLPGGVGLNTNATGADYLKQVADTVAQTIMQSGVMAGGTTGVSKAIQYTRDRGPLQGVAEADAELAKQQALNKWNTNGLNSRIEPTLGGTPEVASTTPDGRIEPTLNPDSAATVTPAEPAGAPAVHPISQTADDIVRELATDAGIPHETVLPTPAPQQTTGPESISDQDVQDFAANRFQQLRQKRDGQIQSVVGETGVVDQDMPGVGLSAAEQQEMDALQRTGDDVQALRKLYGFDQSIPSDQSQLANQAQVPAPATGPVEQPVNGELFPAATEPGLVAAQENSNAQTQEQTQGTGPALGQDAIGSDGIASGPAAQQEPAVQAPAAQNDVGNAVGNPGQQDGTVQASGALTDQQPAPAARQGQFNSADEAQKYISAQRRASSTKLPRALPLPYADGSFGIVTESQPGWPEAQAYAKANAPKTEKQSKERRNGTQATQAEQAKAQGQEAPAAEPVTEAPKSGLAVDAKELGPKDAIYKPSDFAGQSEDAWFNPTANTLETKYVDGTPVKHYAGEGTTNGVVNLKPITTPDEARQALAENKMFVTVGEGSDAVKQPVDAAKPTTEKEAKAKREKKNVKNDEAPTQRTEASQAAADQTPAAAESDEARAGGVPAEAGSSNVEGAGVGFGNYTVADYAYDLQLLEGDKDAYPNMVVLSVGGGTPGLAPEIIASLREKSVLPTVERNRAQFAKDLEKQGAGVMQAAMDNLLKYGRNPVWAEQILLKLRSVGGAQARLANAMLAGARAMWKKGDFKDAFDRMQWFAKSNEARARAFRPNYGVDDKTAIKEFRGLSQAMQKDAFSAGQERAKLVMEELSKQLTSKAEQEPAKPKTEKQAQAKREAENAGATPAETAQIAQEFERVAEAAIDNGVAVHHLFDAPAKDDVVRLQDKVRVYTEKNGWMTVAEAKKQIEQWKEHAAAQGDMAGNPNGDKIVLSLFDKSGQWSQPWEDAGYQVYRFDIQNDPEVGDVNKFDTEFFNDTFGSFEGQDIYAILAACPCTDFASSGARHFAAKDADGRTVSSVKLVHQTLATIEYFKPSVWAIENPVGRIEKLTGLPPWRLSFDPNHLGDPYTKKTLLWGRFNGELPVAPVEATEGSKMHSKYGGSSIATKNARSVTPEGFAYGFFMANNAIDNPVMAIANKYDRLDRNVIKQAVEAGLTDKQIADLVDDPYYFSLDDKAAEQALREAVAERTQTKQQQEPQAVAAQEKKPVQKIEKKATTEAKTESASTTITDFGEKIGGAKKDIWTGFKDQLAEVSDDEIVNQPLSKVWPQTDYQGLIDGGADAWAVAFARAARDEIPSKPRQSWKVKRWAEQVKLLRGTTTKLMDGTLSVERAKQLMSNFSSQGMRDLAGRVELYMLVGHAKSLDGVRIRSGEYSMYNKIEYKPPRVIWTVEKQAAATAFSNWPRELATGATREEALKAFKEKYDALDITPAALKSVSFDIFSERGKEGYFIGKKIGRNLATIEGPFATVKEAREYRANNVAALEEKLAKYKEIPRERRDVNEPRVGEDMRNGQDVTPEMFGETFGFRGVEFGNWVEQKRRQQDLNDAFDGLMDMAAILGIPAKAISLNGELGLAFGARGSGGKNPAAAHYEPGHVVINLTKMNGAGSLGHEWWHALDNYFAKQRKKDGNYMTTALDVSLASRGSNYQPYEGVRKEMIDAFGAVMRSISQTAMKKRSGNLDSKRTKEYWGTGEELSARAFEAYLISKLQDQEASNDYLANIVDEKTWNAAAALGIENENSYPYPTNSELPSIRAGFDQFFQTIQHEETDKGVRLFDFTRSPSLAFLGQPQPVRVNALQKLEKLEAKRTAGKITEAEFQLGVQQVIAAMRNQKEEREYRDATTGRRRGYDWVVAQLNRYVADQQIDREVSNFAEWLLDQNPNLANDLGIGITSKDNVAGDYNPASSVFRLVAGKANTGTAVHEILHHTERMMPEQVQDGVLHEWQRAWFNAFKNGDAKMQQALVDMAKASMGSKPAYDRVQAAFNDGTLTYDKHYQLYSPSEFWAVNATRILSGRYAAKGSWVKRAVQWFKEFVQRIKGVFGLPSDAPVLKALKAVMNGDGQFQQDARMLLDRSDEKTSQSNERTFNDFTRKTQNNAIQFFGNRDGKTLKTFGAYDKTLSTQYNKALKDKHYGKVFGYVNAMQNEVSLTSIRPAELAPGVLPRVDDVKSALATMVKGKQADGPLKHAAQAVFDGTLAGDSVMQGKVWTQAEFMTRPGATEASWGLYQQSRAAIDASLDEVAAAEAYAMAQGFVPKAMRRQIIDNPHQAQGIIANDLKKQMRMLEVAIEKAKKLGAEEQQAELESALKSYQSTLDNIDKIFVTAKNLKTAGYAPLMRFGKFTVSVQQINPQTGQVLRDENGESMTLFFKQYETEGEAKAVRREMESKYADRDDVRVSAGTKSQTAHELYNGITPETLALFAEAIGADNAMRKYIELAMTERSALKRRLHRKGTEGYSDDLPRVLSNFITSNGRHAAQRYYLRDLNNAIKYIPKEKGDVLDEANRLKKFVMNPNDPGAPLSSAMFAWFLGGSVASAIVNLSQPVMMTAPYLSQFGIPTATKAMATAMPYALGKKQISDTALRDALKRASQEGIVDAQEIFHLYSVGAQGVASNLASALAKVPGAGKAIKAGSDDARARINAFLTLWGSMFAVAEGFNRKLTFIAAWEVAKANGEKNPYAFAVRAVNETQGIYNKVNRPNWGQGPVGRTLLTFKQYSIMYVELLTRMWKHGGPEGKRAALIMLAVLMLASGEEGLPFSQDLDDIIDTVGQFMGLDTNMRRNKRRLAHELLGKGLGDLFLYGVSAYLPLDFGGRLGLGNLIPGTGLLKPSNEQGRAREVAEVFGPTAGMATQVADAYDAVVEGNSGKAVQNLAPKAVKDALAAGEMAKKGYATDSKGRKVIDVTKGEAAIKGIGFNPTTVAQETRKTMPVQQDIALQKRTESSIVNQWVRGLADNDMEMAKEAQQRLNDWNRRNPQTPIQITPDQIRNLARQMATEKDARLIKSAPREMRGRIGLDLAK